MLYLDTSAFIKLIVDEPHHGALRATVSQSPARISSTLLRVETIRTVRRIAPDRIDFAESALARIQLLPIDMAIIDRAATLAGPSLHSLDAIHLASAIDIASSVTAFVTYDRQLGRAATAAGLTVFAPGLSA